MSCYSDVKEMVNDVQKIMKDNIEAKKVVDLLKVASFLIVCATFVVQYWDFAFSINIEILPMFPKMLNCFLDKYTFKIFVGLIVYKVIGYEILSYFVIRVCVKFYIKLMPVLNTVDDVFEIGTLFVLLLKLSNNLLLCIQGVDVIGNVDKNMYFIYLIYCVWLFVNWLYVKNKNYRYSANKKYTPYFDCDGKRIAEEDRVVYYGRLYYIYLLDAEEGYSKKEWYLSKSNCGIIHKEILLEDAVRDEKGKIRVYEYGMGEKGK